MSCEKVNLDETKFQLLLTEPQISVVMNEKAKVVSKPKEFTDIVGGNGPWQMAVFAFSLICSFPHCFHNLIMTFFAPNVDHWCARPEEVITANISVEQWRNWSIPMISRYGGGLERSRCTFYNRSVINTTLTTILSPDDAELLPCGSWEYDVASYDSTMVNEWDLVCEREWLVSLAKSVYMVGFLVSVTVCGQLSDRFGRRPVIIGCLLLFLVSGHLTLLSVNFLMFLILRFFVALGMTSVFTISFVILSEVIGDEYRSYYCFNFGYGWVLAYMVLPGIAWLIPGWFWLHMAITVPWLSLLCAFWVIPESPRWLLARGKFSEAEDLLLKAAKKNGKNMKVAKAEISYFMRQQLRSEKEENVTVFDLLRTPALRKNTLNMYFCWFIISYIYYALSWNTNDLGGNPYMTFFISGAVELPALLLFLYVNKAIGHRIALLIANVVSGLCLILMAFVPPDMPWLVITISMVGKFFSSTCFNVVYVYSAEIFPTVARNVGIGSCSMWARVGTFVAPFIKQLSEVTHPAVPLAVPGLLSVLSGFMLLLSPETKNRKIPDTLEEGERFGRDWKSYEEKNQCCKPNNCNMMEEQSFLT